MAFENFTNLFLVAKFLMMLCLVDDIGRDRFHVGLADGEGTVSILPPKAMEPLLFEALCFPPL